MIAAGIALGLVFGYDLQRYIITTIDVDVLMFSRTILARSYINSILLTALFSLLVNLVMYRDIERVDMIAALKSVE